MVRLDVITATAGIILSGLAIKAQLAIAGIAANHLTRALATYTSSSACDVEVVACAADASCATCNTAYAATAEACIGTTTSGYIAESCDELGDIICCAVDGCEDNTTFAAFVGAFSEVLPTSSGANCDVV